MKESSNDAVKVIRNKLKNEHTLTERSSLEVRAMMELLEVCLKTTYFQVDDKFFQHKDGMFMGNALSPVVSNNYMEHFEELALKKADHRPSLWLRYFSDTFVIWQYGPERLQEFFCHINVIRLTIQFTMETEANNKIPFLHVHVIRKQSSIITTVYRKPTHNGRYLNFHSNHSPHVNRAIIRSLHNRATIICRGRQDLDHEVNNIKHDLQVNGVLQNS
jgi:hypothetical protein